MIADVMNAWMSGGRDLRTEGKQRRIRRQQTATGSQSQKASQQSSQYPRRACRGMFDACCLIGFQEFTYTVLKYLRCIKTPIKKANTFFVNLYVKNSAQAN